jgi:hypothetical protein
MQVTVVSNPGIFKGFFVQKLRYHLKQMTLADLHYEFQFYQNDDMKSIGFLRIDKLNPPPDLEKKIESMKKNINETFYYTLSFAKCFTD